MRRILGFVGRLLTFVGIVSAFFAWPVGLILLSWGLGSLAVSGVMTAPGWAFERAHRASKAVWLSAATVGLIPPFGLVYFALWAIRGRAIERACAAGDLAY